MKNAYPTEEELVQREQDRKLERLKAEHDFQTVVSTKEGRRLVASLLGVCGVYQSTFYSDSSIMAYREGRRSIGLYINEMFYSCPDVYIQMITEKDKNERNDSNT